VRRAEAVEGGTLFLRGETVAVPDEVGFVLELAGERECKEQRQELA
jgi:hypothetical protein